VEEVDLALAMGGGSSDEYTEEVDIVWVLGLVFTTTRSGVVHCNNTLDNMPSRNHDYLTST
jgi:hypothetical protein